MNKAELSNKVHSKLEGLSKRDVALVVDLTIESIIESLESGEKVTLYGLGTLDLKPRKGYYTNDVHNDGQLKYIKPSTTVHFKPSRILKNKLNDKGE